MIIRSNYAILQIVGTHVQMYGMVSISATVAKSCLLFMAQKTVGRPSAFEKTQLHTPDVSLIS